MENSATKDSLVVFQTSQNFEFRARALRTTRHLATFDLYTPSLILRRPQISHDFQITVNDPLVHSGRAVVSNWVTTAIFLIGEAALEGRWLDVGLFRLKKTELKLSADFEAFLEDSHL